MRVPPPGPVPVGRRRFLAAVAGIAAACGERTDPDRRPGGARQPAARDAVDQVLLIDAAGPGGFGPFVEEILIAEGLLGVRRVVTAAASPLAVDRVGAVVIHGDLSSSEWINAVLAFVRRGGALVSVCPGSELLSRFGVRVAGPLPPASGVFFGSDSTEPLRLHVEAEGWDVTAGRVEAWFADDAGPTRHAAVVRVSDGEGSAVFWAFDVARNVALIRQGDPAWVPAPAADAREASLIDALAARLKAESLGRPDADVYQRALVGGLSPRSGVPGPLVLTGYFPHGSEAVLVATAAARGLGAKPLDALVRRVERARGRLSIHYALPGSTSTERFLRGVRWSAERLPILGDVLADSSMPPSPRFVGDWRERGHEFAPLSPAGCGLQEGLADAWRAFDEAGYGRGARTLRTDGACGTGGARRSHSATAACA